MTIPQVSNRPPKASSAEVDTGTNDSKYVTPLSLANSKLALPPTDLKLSTASKGGVFNGGFELGTGSATGTSDYWIGDEAYGWGFIGGSLIGGSNVTASYDTTVAHSGKQSMKIVSTSLADYVTIANHINGYASLMFVSPMDFVVTKYFAAMKPSTTYRFSCWVKTDTIASVADGIDFGLYQFSATAHTASAILISKKTGTEDWTHYTTTFTSHASTAYGSPALTWIYSTGTIWIDDIKLEEVVTDTTFTGKVAEKIRPVLQAVTSTDNIDQSLDSGGAYANTYALTNAVNEGATHIQTFTPTKKYTTQIGVWIVEAGTGVDWTLVVHNAANAVQASKTILAAALVEGAMNYIDVPFIWTTGALHFHLYASATTGTPTCKANTSNDLETASYVQRYAKKTEGITVVSNGISTQLKADKDGLLTGSVIDLDNGKYRYDSGTLGSTGSGPTNNLVFANDVYSATAGNGSATTNSIINAWKPLTIGDAILAITQGTTLDQLVVKINTLLPIKHLKLIPKFGSYHATYTAQFEISSDNVNYTTLINYTTPTNAIESEGVTETDLMNGLNVFYLRYTKPADQNSSLGVGQQKIEADLDTSSIPTGLFYPLATNQFTETVKLPSTVNRLYFQSAKYANEYGIVVPALEFCSTATPVGYVPLKLDNTQETSPCVSILSTTTNYQQSGTGSNVTGGVVLNTGEYVTLTSAVSELKVDYQVGTGTTAIAAITKNTMYLSSNGDGNDSTQDPSHQANFIVGVRQQGLTDRVKDLGNEIAGVREGVVKSSKWTEWTPTLTWTTGTPEGSVVTKARYKIVDGVCNFSFYYSATDGNGATALTITLPVYPKDNDSVVSLSGQMLDDTNWNNPLPYIEDGGTTIVFRALTTAGDGFQTVADAKAVKVIVAGSYEI